ncbi:hypothetical protein LJC59_03420 [Desulfovibrio sp. OttesenSCG-928-A18]|nr:hypothetical protein [Desulfovibrio sp. OttesenSCG-928-A18]
MIPCYICGKDASTGWTKGFVPAPDSQKLALCIAHDSPENRLRVEEAWRELRLHDLATMTELARQKAAPERNIVSVHFTGGGMLSFICSGCAPTGHGTLRIEQEDGSHTYIPMRHIREYSLHPYAPDAIAPQPASGEVAAPDAALPTKEGQARPLCEPPCESLGEPLCDKGTQADAERHHGQLNATTQEKAEAAPATAGSTPERQKSSPFQTPPPPGRKKSAASEEV